MQYVMWFAIFLIPGAIVMVGFWLESKQDDPW